MKEINAKEIENLVYALALKAGTTLTGDCARALFKAEKYETSVASKFALDTILKNKEVAEKEKMPVCQDTGMAVVMLEIGQDAHIFGGDLTAAVNEGVRRAYKDGYFRKSVCDPLTRVNTADNTPAVIHTEIVAGDKVKIAFMPKGFGSENMSKIYMLTPADGVEGVIDCIVKTVKDAGSRPCPPVYVGVGIGGTFDRCAYLAKKALLREVGSENPREDVAEIEREALKRINALGIGCQGFGGDVTALGVSCELEPTHIAGLPVAVNIQCHCIRCEKGEL